MINGPVSAPQTHTVTVTGYASGGEGVARPGDGSATFIRNAARGDVLEIEMIHKRKRSARGRIVKIIKASPYRIEPDCPYYPECGGCDFRHLTYEEELAAKLLRVNDALRRIGGQSSRVGDILHTGQINGYRNKAVLHSDGVSIGFYKPRSRDIVAVGRCLLLKDDLNDAFASLQPRGDITLRSGRNGMGRPLEEELDGLVFRIESFFQVNTGAALLLYRKVREYADLSGGETLVDMYCGVGAMTLFAGRDAGYALGIENDRAAVGAARINAGLNGMGHIEFIRADAAEWDADIIKTGCVIVDPPRNGLSAGAVRKLLGLSAGRIVYVSCDPATLARDLRAIEGYALKDACAVDMFPRTANVEICCLLVKEG